MEQYFNINYEFDKQSVFSSIDRQLQTALPGYICVADGVILNTANRRDDYLEVVNGSMFSICDSSYVPLYLRWLYGIERKQYCGSEIFMDIIRQKKYRMFFMGTSQGILQGLSHHLSQIDERINGMTFYELPFCNVEDFDYPGIAQMIDEDGAEIIWVALGAPKQEIFMSRLKPHLKRGVMIAVGAAFKFYSGTDVKRAPHWMVKMHLEFAYRIFSEPKKQLKRCAWIVYTLPGLLYREWRKKKLATNFIR
ncbi:WecB/TagA/CpsF family glycosyltransferase [Bacteroides difficilis]|mgnify:FL=1|uniref:WecB/TagA/CpsF family glycosyltransferase n=1 Tax=Bacteroides difficilis TaxID=2763021 RepID=A0ABR7CCQ9_9BACE|nr:WecB/TagA/CpsF family glycosyltransferase [Bacteroides difficilis]MBC5605578.1 WecB/TagA/CpsF family glycosyltransferase [Bacteroides difficilis]